MAWAVTLHVFDNVTKANIVGASVYAPDIVVLKTTDANGDWIFEELDDSITGEIVQISKVGYISKNFEIDQAQKGHTQEVGLNPSPHGTVDPNVPTGRGNSCFTSDTRITMYDGAETSIALIRKGDFVLGRSGQPNRVIGIERPLLGSRKLYALNGGIAFVTAEHPFLTEAGWKAIDPEATAAENPYLVVGRLAVKDVLLKLQGCAVGVGSSGSGESIEVVLEPISLVSLKERHADPATPLYNLLLEGDHAYFANGLLVHNKGCFIVSATTGSPQSEEVILLRRLRDRVGGASSIAAQLIDTIYNDYYQFSPRIAAELERDTIARNAVLLLIVRPLLAWYTLAGKLAFDHIDKEAIRQAAQDVLSSCPCHLGGASISTLVEAIRAGGVLPADTPPLLLDFAPRIREGARLRFASWAILDPLVRAWQSATDHLDLVDEVAGWLATAPLEALAPPRDPKVLDVELAVLAGFFDFRPMARRQLGERLMAAWPDAAGALERAGFVSRALNREEE